MIPWFSTAGNWCWSVCEFVLNIPQLTLQLSVSIQKCSSGFYREQTGPNRGQCVPCSCNGLSNQCDALTGNCVVGVLTHTHTHTHTLHWHVLPEDLQEKLTFFLLTKPYNKDIYDQIQCSAALLLWWAVQSRELELIAEATAGWKQQRFGGISSSWQSV